MIKKPWIGSRVKKRLSDITNIHSQQKSPLKDQENFISAVDESSTKNYVQQLLKVNQENTRMMKLIQEKDKIIELNGLELQKLRVNLQKTQLQNLQLAQSNTQMLAELNMGKDRMKALHHELACKDALYKSKLLDLQDKAKLQLEENSILGEETKPTKAVVNQKPEKAAVNQKPEKAAVDQKPEKAVVDQKPEKAVVDQTKQDNDSDENKVSKTKRGRPTRSHSLGPTRSQQAVDKDIAETKRRCLRRQSVRLKPQDAQADLFELDVVTPFTEPLEQTLPASNSEREDVKESVSQSSKHSLPQRPSIGRPVRRAAEKIQSYKDPPRNTKMRRPE